MDLQEAGTGTMSRPYILFKVAGTTYGAPSHLVRHIEMVDQVTAVPNAAAFVEGVVFSRGQVVPVVNLRVRFGFAPAPRDLRARLLVVEVAGRTIALLTDEAREFVSIPDAAIHPPGEGIAGLSGNYLEGIATIGERIVLILDVARVIEAVPGVAA
jgi:purine-binding chemotaxis protein CheW